MTSVARRQEDDSGEYSDASHENEPNLSGNDPGQAESDYDSQGSDSEHSERDPESQEAEKKVDDDEDRSNPQYIPKRGTFYEHDDRTAASGEETANTTTETPSEGKKENEPPAERRRPPRKSEIIDKWGHDKFNEKEQTPKSREELVAIYGYDIRNEDAPPHARRNRKYGRGPNKYTRTWEDGDAYKRQAAQQQPRKPPTAEDFPELDTSNNNRMRKKTRPARPRSKSQPPSDESLDKVVQLRRNASAKGKPKPSGVSARLAPTARHSPRDQLPALENLTITASVTNNGQSAPPRKVNTGPVSQQRPVPTEQQLKKKPQVGGSTGSAQHSPATQQQSNQQQASNKSQQLPQTPSNAANTSQEQNTGLESRGGSKRYSSLRQRPLAENYTPAPQQNQQQPPHRYNEFPNTVPPQAPQPHQGSPVPQIHPQMIHQQVHRNSQSSHGPSPPHPAIQQQPPQHNQQVRIGMLEQQQLVQHPHHTIHNMPQQHNIAQLQPAQGYAPPAMMPAQYMQLPGTQQPNAGAVYGGGTMYAQPPAPYAHQMYQHHNYQSAPTTGYYREHPPRRPTAAIPIVPPDAPAKTAPPTDRPAPNSAEKDNIDRIVENMFVRKPWPASHGSDSKEKSETRSSQEPQSKESSQPNSLTSSSVSIESKPSENKEEPIVLNQTDAKEDLTTTNQEQTVASTVSHDEEIAATDA